MLAENGMKGWNAEEDAKDAMETITPMVRVLW
jgi:hypothetical protein